MLYKDLTIKMKGFYIKKWQLLRYSYAHYQFGQKPQVFCCTVGQQDMKTESGFRDRSYEYCYRGKADS